MKCRQCGAELSARSRFCDVCGTPIMNDQAFGNRENEVYQAADSRPDRTGEQMQLPSYRALPDNVRPDRMQPKKNGNKTKVILISLIVFLLVAATALGIALFLNGNSVSQAELDEAKKQFVPPAEAIEIDASLDDPSNEKVKFTFDSESRIETCSYRVNNKDYVLKYSYDNAKELVKIDVNYRDHVISSKEIEYTRVLRPDRFEQIDGYYLRLQREYVGEPASDAETEGAAQTDAPKETETRGFGIGRVISTEEQTEAFETEPETESSGGQYSPQAIPIIPDEVTDFVETYGVYCGKDFDSRRAPESDKNVLTYIVHNFPCVQIDSRNNLYPGNGYDFVNQSQEAAAACPWDNKGLGAWRFDDVTVDWVCRNIFNITDEQIEQFYQEAFDDQLIWKYEGDYCILGGGKGSPFVTTKIERYQTDGKYYHIAYRKYELKSADTDDLGEELGFYYMVLEKKTIDGREYWSMHYHSDDVPYVFEPFDING